MAAFTGGTFQAKGSSYPIRYCPASRLNRDDEAID
jgi:hypothetical protein